MTRERKEIRHTSQNLNSNVQEYESINFYLNLNKIKKDKLKKTNN